MRERAEPVEPVSVRQHFTALSLSAAFSFGIWKARYSQGLLSLYIRLLWITNEEIQTWRYQKLHSLVFSVFQHNSSELPGEGPDHAGIRITACDSTLWLWSTHSTHVSSGDHVAVNQCKGLNLEIPKVWLAITTACDVASPFTHSGSLLKANSSTCTPPL